jgi:hypothetical protein
MQYHENPHDSTLMSGGRADEHCETAEQLNEYLSPMPYVRGRTRKARRIETKSRSGRDEFA